MSAEKVLLARLINYVDDHCEHEVVGPYKARVEKKCKAKMSLARRKLGEGNYKAALDHSVRALQLIAWTWGNAGVGSVESYD